MIFLDDLETVARFFSAGKVAFTTTDGSLVTVFPGTTLAESYRRFEEIMGCRRIAD